MKRFRRYLYGHSLTSGFQKSRISHSKEPYIHIQRALHLCMKCFRWCIYGHSVGSGLQKSPISHPKEPYIRVQRTPYAYQMSLLNQIKRDLCLRRCIYGHSVTSGLQMSPISVSKEPHDQFKSNVYPYQKISTPLSSEHHIHIKRVSLSVSKETYVVDVASMATLLHQHHQVFKRALNFLSKRPTSVSKEPQMYVKRVLYPYQRRSACVSKETYVRIKKRPAWSTMRRWPLLCIRSLKEPCICIQRALYVIQKRPWCNSKEL